MKVKNKKELVKEIRRAIAKHGNEVDLNYIDTSQITDMSYLFYDFPDFNGKIENWDTSQVTDMSYMFAWAENFNQPLNFDISKVTNMRWMFFNAKKFNQELDWNTQNIVRKERMFKGSKGKLINKNRIK